MKLLDCFFVDFFVELAFSVVTVDYMAFLYPTRLNCLCHACRQNPSASLVYLLTDQPFEMLRIFVLHYIVFFNGSARPLIPHSSPHLLRNT